MTNKKSCLISMLSTVVLICYVLTGLAASNPASTNYVDQKIAMLQFQIASIQGVPAGGMAGQILAKSSNRNYDTQWINQPPTAQYTLGQHTQGGVVFFMYIDSLNVQHALIAATTDEPGGSQYNQNSAVIQCANKSEDGFTDWFLPNKAQMSALFNNRFAIDPTAINGNGGFSESISTPVSSYWSSTTVSDSSGRGWYQRFTDGTQNNLTVNNTFSVRCIRTA